LAPFDGFFDFGSGFPAVPAGETGVFDHSWFPARFRTAWSEDMMCFFYYWREVPRQIEYALDDRSGKYENTKWIRGVGR
jgi:hypothetical protein